jgi:hypothetical protein
MTSRRWRSRCGGFGAVSTGHESLRWDCQWTRIGWEQWCGGPLQWTRSAEVARRRGALSGVLSRPEKKKGKRRRWPLSSESRPSVTERTGTLSRLRWTGGWAALVGFGPLVGLLFFLFHFFFHFLFSILNSLTNIWIYFCRFWILDLF